MKLIVITSSDTTEKESAIIAQLFEYGLGTLHLRKPRMSTKEMRSFIETIPAHFHNRIVLHSHHKLAAKYALKGIHLTRAHRKRRFRMWYRLRMLKLRRPQLTVSTSYSKLASIYEDDRIFNYVFLSPIFDSLTGRYHSGYSEHSLRAAIEKNDINVVARGGVCADNVSKVLDLGFHGMALHSALWRKGEPVEEFSRVLDKFRELGIKNE